MKTEYEYYKEGEEAIARADAAAVLPPGLLQVFDWLEDSLFALPCDTTFTQDGSEWGCSGPAIRMDSGVYDCAFVLALSRDDPGVLRVTRDPHWPEYNPACVAFRLDDPATRGRLWHLLDNRDPDDLEDHVTRGRFWGLRDVE